MHFLFNKSRSLRHKVIGINQRNVELIYPHNKRKDYALADDKVLTKEILEKENIACAKTYAVINRIGEIKEVWSQISKYNTIAIKPANGRGGGGIKILRQENNTWYSSGKPVSDVQIFKHFADILMGVYSLSSKDSVLIEYCIEAHPFFHQIYPTGVPDFRIILLNNFPVLSMLRLPTNQSDGKANLHQGGLGIGIDMLNGQLTSGYYNNQYCSAHPDTQFHFTGKQLPLWQETLELAIATSKVFPLEYLGIDIVLDKTLGPLIMEINVRPGLAIQLVNQKGYQEIFRETPALKGILTEA